MTFNCNFRIIVFGGRLMTFGARLRQLRRAQGMNQRTLAARVGLDCPDLRKIENGRMAPPSADTMVKMARARQADELLR